MIVDEKEYLKDGHKVTHITAQDKLIIVAINSSNINNKGAIDDQRNRPEVSNI